MNTDYFSNLNKNFENFAEKFYEKIKDIKLNEKAMFNINETGAWESDSDYGHVYDNKLSNFLNNFLKKESIKTVVDFGCGMGDYAKFFISNGFEVDAFDGNPNTETLTKGIAKVLDLSIPFNLNKKYDCVLSLEVGEHIPKEYEQVFLDNLANHSNNLIILSWAIPGQPGLGHVNCQNNEYIIEQLNNRNFYYDALNSQFFRKFYSVAPWFKDTLMLFRKNKG